MTQRLPQRTMDSTRPIPGMVSPRAAIRIPSGPSRTAVPSRTSTTVQPGIVAGLVSGGATTGCRIASAAAEGLAFAWEAGLADGRAPAGSRADGLGMLPTMAGESDADAVFRVPSILPLDRASEIRGEGVSFCATATRSNSLANWGQFRPPAHPSPKLATSCCSDQQGGACPIAKWLPHHQYFAAVGRQEIPQARGLLRPLAANHIPRPYLKGTRLAVLHGVIQVRLTDDVPLS